ncbi:MAG: beta-N-acetylhexosaminidase [Deltaproteobacteria bacterium]|nr:beta-N-acetylhexosaminidase [Deltaproteobacteria bacterium]
MRGLPALRKNPLARKVDEARVQRVFASLELRARAAQLVLAYPQLDKSGPVEVGGVLYVGNALANIPKAKERIQSAVARARVPPFVAVDMEGGPFNRMKRYPGLKDLPVARDLAALDDKEVRAWGKKVGEAMRAVGLNLNLAPVLDVAASGHMSNNQRSFSGEPQVVVQKARAFAEGLLAAGVVPIGKHFPGYGDLAGDSDHELATADWDKAKVLAQVAPFDGAKDVLGGVMMSNVVYSSVDAKPAILSAPLVALAHERGWLTVTDDVSIRVLADAIDGTSEDVLRAALMAGNDLLLTTAPPDWDKGIDYLGVLAAYAQENPKAREKVDAACRRVLRLKDRMGLLDGL